MTFIQRVRFIHSEFEEKCGGDRTKVTTEFQKECCMEIGYQIEEKTNSKGGNGNKHSDLLRGVNIFQLAFRIGDVWRLIDEILACGKTLPLKTRRSKSLSHSYVATVN